MDSNCAFDSSAIVVLIEIIYWLQGHQASFFLVHNLDMYTYEANEKERSRIHKKEGGKESEKEINNIKRWFVQKQIVAEGKASM